MKKILLFLTIFLFFPLISSASTNISSDVHEHWAYNDTIGWINFYSTDNVNVTALKVEGYANSDIGYVALDCGTSPNGNICNQSNFYVSNDGYGDLSGYAWSDAIGWISFNCADPGVCAQSNYKVTIDASGYFHGWAWNDNVGWISFNCDQPETGNTCSTVSYYLKTSWQRGVFRGYLLSSIIDTGVKKGATLNSLVWKGDMPAGTAVRFQIASSNSLTGGGTGTIDDTWRYAWNDTTGWWDFGYPDGEVNVDQNEMTGYGYNSRIGYIALNSSSTPLGLNYTGTSFKVNHDPVTGDLSGWAWNDYIGWISFNSETDGVSSDYDYKVTVATSTGVFSGWAWNDEVGWISFNCADTGLDCGGTTTNYYVRVAPTMSAPFIGPNGTSNPSDTYDPLGPGIPVKINKTYHHDQRYFRYKVILESDNFQLYSPRVDDVIINWSP